MVYKQPFSVDPSGPWSPRQARAVLAIIGPEAAARGVRFDTLDITSIHTGRRVRLVPVCIKHDYPIATDDVCAACLRGES